MRRSMIKRILCAGTGLLMALTAIFAFDLSAFAEETYRFSLDQSSDIEIILQYEGAAPSVSVVGPDASYTSDADYAKVETGSSTKYLYIRDASAGSWEIISDKKITHTVLGWHMSPVITSFTMEENDNESLELKTSVSCEKDTSYDWYIYATSLDANGNPAAARLLYQTSGRTNSERSAYVSTRNLPDGTYRLAMEAVITYPDETETMDTAEIAKTFTVTGHTAIGDDSELVTVYDLTDNTLDIDWSNISSGYDEMLVSVTQGGSEQIFYDTVARNVKAVQVIADPDAGDTLAVELMPMKGENYDTKYTRSVPIDPGVSVSIDTPEATGELMTSISYDTADKTIPIVIMLGGNSDSYRISGTGSLSVPLETFENNELTVRMDMGGGRYYILHKTISVNNLPPLLTLYGVSDGMITEAESITIKGKTDPEATLAIDGKNVEVSSEGEFTAEIRLAVGENHIEFVSESKYGIKTKRSLTVNKLSGGMFSGIGSGKLKGFITFLFALAAALITVSVVLLVGHLSKRRGRSVKQTLFRLLIAVLALCDTGFIIAAVYCGTRVHEVLKTISGPALAKVISDSSVYGVSEALALRDIWKGRMWSMIITAIVFTCVILALLILSLVRKNKKKNISTEKRNNNQQ